MLKQKFLCKETNNKLHYKKSVKLKGKKLCYSSIAILRKCICRGRRPRRPQIPIIQSRGMPWAASPTIQLFFVNAFVGDGVPDVPKSPLYKIEVYSSIVTLFGNVSCPPKRDFSSMLFFSSTSIVLLPVSKGTTSRRGGEPIKPQ